MLNVNSTQYRQNFADYLMGCVDNEDNPSQTETIKGKLEYIMSRFDAEYNYKNNRMRYPNLADRMANYLMGLPFSFAFDNYEVKQVAAKLHGIDSIPEKKQAMILSQWFQHLAHMILKLANKEGIAHPV